MATIRDGLRAPLPWPASVLLLSLACYPIAWVCMASAAAKEASDVPALAGTFIFLVGLVPFFARRDYWLNGGGLLAISGVGLAIAGIGWLFDSNFFVLVFFGMAWAMGLAAQPSAYGKATRHRIELEKLTYGNPPTAIRERWLHTLDFLTVLGLGLMLLWAYSAFAGDAAATAPRAGEAAFATSPHADKPRRMH